LNDDRRDAPARFILSWFFAFAPFQGVFRSPQAIAALHQSKITTKHGRFQPVSSERFNRDKPFAAAPEDFEADGRLPGIDEPVFLNSRREIEHGQVDGVFLLRRIAHDFERHLW